MPLRVPIWNEVMACVDLSQPARSPKEIWGRWLPEPATILGTETDRRRETYIRNWLRFRPGWLYLLRDPQARVTSVCVQWWRDILLGAMDIGDPETAASKRWNKIQLYFGQIFQKDDWKASNDMLHWFDHHMERVDDDLIPLILWELTELGFRHELLALDRLLVPHRQEIWREVEREELLGRIYPDKNAFAPTRIPVRPSGLADAYTFKRVDCLEAFRRVLMRWPGCPNTIATDPIYRNWSEADILAAERAMVSFYVHTFVAYSGRAPMVPHLPPQYTPPGLLDSDVGHMLSDGSDIEI